MSTHVSGQLPVLPVFLLPYAYAFSLSALDASLVEVVFIRVSSGEFLTTSTKTLTRNGWSTFAGK